VKNDRLTLPNAPRKLECGNAIEPLLL
jgi:hypothetical protein